MAEEQIEKELSQLNLTQQTTTTTIRKRAKKTANKSLPQLNSLRDEANERFRNWTPVCPGETKFYQKILELEMRYC